MLNFINILVILVSGTKLLEKQKFKELSIKIKSLSTKVSHCLKFED